MPEKDPKRLEVLKKIDALERAGIFDQDVEEDPPGTTIAPGTVDYCQKKLRTRIKAKIAFGVARKFLHKVVREKQLIIKDIVGIENLDSLNSGAILTCNHFSPMDSFIMQVAYEKSVQAKKRKLFRVVREGNYTSFPGFYGMLMRNCNTLPLASNLQTTLEFLKGVNYQLRKGNYVLIYPEQSLWWNYRKPKPLKSGGYNLAIRANVPVVPIFIAMEDSILIGEDGFPIQMNTVFVGKPIFPDETLSYPEAKQKMMDENFRVWKECYESFYHVPLTYLCDKKSETPKI